MKDKVIIEARIILCKQVAEIARANGLTQDDVAIHSGLARATVNRMFSGKFAVPIDTFLKICRVVDASILIENSCK
tara:strand:- start:1196 stop:1423 length:228 start_codon:yes stop_codon:yes gene_type:complete